MLLLDSASTPQVHCHGWPRQHSPRGRQSQKRFGQPARQKRANQSLGQEADDTVKCVKRSKVRLPCLGDQFSVSQADIQRDFNIRLQGTILSFKTAQSQSSSSLEMLLLNYWVNEWKWQTEVSEGHKMTPHIFFQNLYQHVSFPLSFPRSLFLYVCAFQVSNGSASSTPCRFQPAACGCNFKVSLLILKLNLYFFFFTCPRFPWCMTSAFLHLCLTHVCFSG